MEIRKVGVVGCGLMGGGIAQVAAQSGFETVVREVSQELIDKGMARIDGILARDVTKGKLTAHAKDWALSLIKPTTDLHAFADCQIVVEAIIENLDAKRELYAALDAVRMLESGIATREDIDKGMQLGCGYPMGPLALLDFVGLDTTYYIAEIMFEEFKEPRFAPPPLLKRMVLAGHLGRKSGTGFYEYDDAPGPDRASAPSQ